MHVSWIYTRCVYTNNQYLVIQWMEMTPKVDR